MVDLRERYASDQLSFAERLWGELGDYHLKPIP